LFVTSPNIAVDSLIAAESFPSIWIVDSVRVSTVPVNGPGPWTWMPIRFAPDANAPSRSPYESVSVGE
jgi:hypothetical protein